MSTRKGVRRRTARVVLAATLAVALVLGMGATAAMGTWLSSSSTVMVSLADDDSQSPKGSRSGVVSDDGRYVAFMTKGDLDPIETGGNNYRDIYVRDVENGSTLLVSEGQTAGGAPEEANGDSGHNSWWHRDVAMSADGRYIAFASDADNLLPAAADTNNDWDVFVYDMNDGSITRVSVADDESESNDDSFNPSISPDGRYVAFESDADDLIGAGNDTNNSTDIFVRDTTANTTTRVSVADDESEAGNDSHFPSISDDGKTIAFDSTANNLIGAGNDTNGWDDVFVRDVTAGTTTRVSVTAGGTEGDNDSERPSISGDGRFVAFSSWAGNLSPDDMNGDGAQDVFLHDRDSGDLTHVSVPRDDGFEKYRGATYAHISRDGRHVAFASGMDLVAGDTNSTADIFVYDAMAGTTYLASKSFSGVSADDNSRHPSFSPNGQFLVFDSAAANIVEGDANRGYGGTNDSTGRDVFLMQWGPMLDSGVMRYAGADRYATAIAVSQSAWPDDSVDTVVIATGADWPDALSGSALAGTVGGPILLTTMDALPTTVKTEIARLGAENAYVVGGAGVVSSAVMAELDGILDGTVTRLAGQTRYGTSRAIADEVIAQQMGFFDGTGIVTTGGNFADALAGAPLGAGLGWPVLLASPTTGDVYMPPAMTDAVILGGPGAVPVAGETALKSALGDAMVTRIGGATRYETAAMTAEYGVDSGLLWNGVGLATGELFPDGLTGGAALGSQRTVMLLTTTGNLAPATGVALDDNKSDIKTVQIIGGPGAVSPAVENQVKSILGM